MAVLGDGRGSDWGERTAHGVCWSHYVYIIATVINYGNTMFYKMPSYSLSFLDSSLILILRDIGLWQVGM